MAKDYILFIDSGIGGLSTLCETYKILPANYIYYADNKNVPYGNHSAEEIYKFLEKIIIHLTKRYPIKIVVLACNTATTSAISKLRKNFNHLNFIGTEPAIKLACKLGYKNIFCISTLATANQEKFIKLKNSLNSNVFCYPSKTLAQNIENFFTQKFNKTNFWCEYLIKKELTTIVYKAKNCDCIVLGCTHYVFFKHDFEKFSNTSIIDGNVGVAKQVLKISQSLKLKQENTSSIKFLLSKPEFVTNKIYKKIFYEILAKVWNLC